MRQSKNKKNLSLALMLLLCSGLCGLILRAAVARASEWNHLTTTAVESTPANDTQSRATPPLTAENGGRSFQNRCAAPGVLKCVGFDSPREVFAHLSPAWDGIIRGSLDTEIFADGGGSLKFTIPPLSPANTSGVWSAPMGRDFGEDSTFFVQWRQRFSPELLKTVFKSNGFKQHIFWHGIGGSCTDVQLVTENTYGRGFPQMYTACGARGLEIAQPDGDVQLEQGDYNCYYRNQNPGDCAMYRPNDWMTFYYEVHIGKWNQPSSTVKAWVGYEGKPLKEFIDISKLTISNDSPEAKAFRRIDLLPYQTDKDSTIVHPIAYTWYDDLIISTRPIPAPTGPTPTP
jgi:hypothetical protein